MAMPKKRVSKQRKRTRRANWKLTAPGIVSCPRCHASVLSHRVCKECGYYGGKQIIKVEAKQKKA